MKPKRKIAWEKWDDDILNEEIADNLHVNEDDEELADDALELMSKIPKLVSTPLGIFQLYDKMSPIRQFECWMGYTNFDITRHIEKQVEKIKGVELLFVISRYRFFVGVAKMFNFRNVRIIRKRQYSDSSRIIPSHFNIMIDLDICLTTTNTNQSNQHKPDGTLKTFRGARSHK